MDRIERDMLRGHLDAIVLSALERGEGHGYEVLQRLREISSNALQLKEGSLYPALYRLEEAKLIEAHWDSNTGKRQGPRRRIYAITPKGKKSLSERREQWTRFSSIIGNIMEASS